MRTISVMTLFIVALAAAAIQDCGTEHICGTTGGKPADECKLFGLEALSKDDYNQKVASRDAALTLVKAGTCFTLYHCASKGTILAAADGKDISHVTYCGAYNPATCTKGCNVQAEKTVEVPKPAEPKVEKPVEPVVQPAVEPVVQPAVEPVVQPAVEPAKEIEPIQVPVAPIEPVVAVVDQVKHALPVEPVEEIKIRHALPVEPKVVEYEAPKAVKPAVIVEPKPVIVDVPCNHQTLDTDLPRVIYIAAEEEDCTSALKKEVTELELLVDKLNLLLKIKGVKVGTGDLCTIPGEKKTEEKDGGDRKGEETTTKAGETTKAGDTTKVGETTKTGEITKPRDEKDGGNKNGEETTTKAGETTKPKDEKDGGNKNGEETTTKPGDAPTTSAEGGNGPSDRASSGTTSSSAASNAMMTVGIVVGAAVAAGIAAVAIGFVASGAAAGAAAPASAAPMAAACTNPLYSPVANGAQNAMFQ